MKNIAKGFAALALATIPIFSASSAKAAEVVYTSSGVFDGLLDGVAFTGKDLHFVGTGDDADTYDAFGEQTTPLSSLRFVLDGVTYDVEGKTSVFVAIEDGFAGFVGEGDAGTFGILRFAFDPNTKGATWPVTFYSDALTAPAETTAGTMLLTFGSNMTFKNGGNISAVPEPSAWLLLIAGFGVAGVVLRHRRTDDARHLV